MFLNKSFTSKNLIIHNKTKNKQKTQQIVEQLQKLKKILQYKHNVLFENMIVSKKTQNCNYITSGIYLTCNLPTINYSFLAIVVVADHHHATEVMVLTGEVITRKINVTKNEIHFCKDGMNTSCSRW